MGCPGSQNGKVSQGEESAQLCSDAAERSRKRRSENGVCIWQLVTLKRAVGVDADSERLFGKRSRERGRKKIGTGEQ